jgi:hypothetical protein
MLIIVGIFGSSLITTSSIPRGNFNQMISSDDVEEDNTSNHYPNLKGSEVTQGTTTLKTDKDSYSPGETAIITAEGTTAELNGSLEWQLESPIEEIAFDFESRYQDIFQDPSFNDPSVPDWYNESFDSVEATSGYLNLTQTTDPDMSSSEIYYNDTMLKEEEEYVISFDYLSQGANLLNSPSFESGLSDWEGILTPLNVSLIEDKRNASDGDYYVRVNNTNGNILYQNISITSEQYISFSARATGVSSANNWELRLEAYNDTDPTKAKGSKTSSDSVNLIPDVKSYAFNRIYNWKVPANTSYVRAIFKSDGKYTGWVDDLIFAVVPPVLYVSYWGEAQKWTNYTNLQSGTHQWESVEISLKIGVNHPVTKTIKIILPDTNSFVDNTTAFWLIDNFAVNLVEVPEKRTQISTVRNTGTIHSTWFHRDFREDLTSDFDIKAEEPVNVTASADVSATIKIKLPQYQVYFGSWTFVFKIHRVDDLGDPLDSTTINISFLIQDNMNYVVQDLYVLRGYTNETVGNDSVFTEYFERETTIQSISPGDNVTIIGYLEANSTSNESFHDFYDLEYLQIGTVSTYFLWNSSSSPNKRYTWSGFGFIPYNTEGKTVLEGKFDSPHNNSKSFGINFKIPNKGIYGNVSSNLTISIIGTKSYGIAIDIPITIPTVIFKINVLQEDLPETYYYLSEYLRGNITVEFYNINDTLESNFPGRNISSKLNIAVSEIDLTIFIDDLSRTPTDIDVSQEFHYRIIENTILWLDPIDPHLQKGEYKFLIRWDTPHSLGIQDQAFLDIMDLNITIEGDLLVVPSEETTKIDQGGQRTINFSVHLTDSQGGYIKSLGGLNLIGKIAGNESFGNLIIYEQNGIYFIDLDVELEAEPKLYSIEILIFGRDDLLEGSIDFEVEEPDVSTIPLLSLASLFDIGGFLIIVFSGVVFAGLMFLVNKKMD